MKEVAVQGEALVCAFLGVELGSENIIACNCGGKAGAVVGVARDLQAVGDDPTYGADGINQNDFGNFLLFPNQSGPTVTIIAIDQPMPSLPGYDSSLRAPINGVQIVGH